MINAERAALVIDANWPDGVVAGDVDLADIVIRAADQDYTRLAAPTRGEIQEYLSASAVSLALFFARNWWRLRYEPIPGTPVPPVEWRLRHELTAAEGGVLWPPIMIYGEGARVLFAPRAGYYDVYGPLGYLKADIAPVDASAYEFVLDEFFYKVIGKCASALDGNALGSLVAQIRAERNDAEVASWRRLEAQLSFDPDEAPDALMLEFKKRQERYGEAAVAEAAIASPGPGSARRLEEVLAATYDSPVRVALGSARELTSAGSRPTPHSPPWKLAEACAQELRQVIGVKPGPMSNVVLCDALGVTLERGIKGQPRARNLAYGAIALDEKNDQNRFALHSSARSRARRFELARALGDAAWIGNTSLWRDSFAPISTAKSDRQKFQRAFAQSYLCPFSDIMTALGSEEPSDSDIERVAVEFDVYQKVIEMVLVNKKIVPRERFADRLEAA